jgi:hypothetical protein
MSDDCTSSCTSSCTSNLNLNLNKIDLSLNSEYNTKLNNYINQIITTDYIFEVTKICGYSEFFFIHKDHTLLELYNQISLQFSCKDIKSLFIAAGVRRYNIPITSMTSVRKFITDGLADSNLKNFLNPVYPLPAKVVYKIYLDDGHSTNNCC